MIVSMRLKLAVIIVGRAFFNHPFLFSSILDSSYMGDILYVGDPRNSLSSLYHPKRALHADLDECVSFKIDPSAMWFPPSSLIKCLGLSCLVALYYIHASAKIYFGWRITYIL